MESPVQARSLRAATAKGFLWGTAQSLLVHALSLISFVVLARLLTPAEYGIAALARVFASLLVMIGNAGMGPALIQRPSIDKADLDTVFWIGTGVGIALAAGLSLAAWPLADLFGEPDLRPVLQLVSVGFVFIGLGSTQAAVLQRGLEFRAIALSTLAANLAATVVGISFGVAGFGVYALVAQTLLAPIVLAVANSLQSGYRPGRAVSWARFRALFDYSRHVLGSAMLSFANSRTDDVLVGGVLGSAALGVYSVGYRVLTIILDLMTAIGRSVAFPIFARLQGDEGRLRHGHASATRMTAVIAFPLFVFVLVAAPVVVPVVFGDRWNASIPVMQILCLYGPVYALVQLNTTLLQSVGRARLVFRVALVGTVVQVVLFAVAVGFGIRWVAAAFVAGAYLVAPIAVRAAAREIGVPVRQSLRMVAGPALGAAIMAVAVLLVREGLEGRLAQAPLLAVLIVTGAAVYGITLRLLGAGLLTEAATYVRAGLSQAAQPAGPGL